MNPLLNPLVAGKIIKHYLTDTDRVWRLKPEEIENLNRKALRRVLKYAYNVPIYRKKYREYGVDIDRIKTMDDLKRLPIIKKKDIIDGFPDGIVPKNFNKNQAYLVSTSGSSGVSVPIYKDFVNISMESILGVRQLRTYGLSWRKSKITSIGDFSIPRSTDEECFEKGMIRNLSLFFSMKNYQNIYTGENLKSIMKKIDDFKPELLTGFTSVLREIAFLKKNGFGKHINPKCIISGGEILDHYSRRYIEDAFNCDVFDLYATTEGGSIAFECTNKKMHINSDFIHVEIIDEEGNTVPPGETGNVVITKLYNGGTPIIRYDGLNDLAALSDEKCSCGLNTPLIKSLEGRRDDAVVLPSGKVFSPAMFPIIIDILSTELNTNQIKRFQFVQKKIDEIEIRIEIDDRYRDESISTEELLDEIEKRYKIFVNNEAKIHVKEVKSIERNKNSNLHPIVISKLDRKKIEEALL